ncbi:hypothetical protein [Mycetocola sp.]|uniref:hypothetical protein n=1 Tax=Mycetocola sp. TaxID=1871042 RepID=UPI00398A4B63
MTDRAASGIVEPRDVATASWPQAFVIYGVLAVMLGVGAIFGIMLMIPLGFALVLGAIPYTLTATFFIVRERRAARRALDAMQDFHVEMSIADFGGRAQKLSLLNGVVLGLLGLLLAVTTVNAVPLPDSTMFLLALIAAFSGVEIVANAGWIYRRKTVLAEEYALRTRTHSWKLILANRWLGWAIWYTGAGIAGFVLVTQPSNFFL